VASRPAEREVDVAAEAEREGGLRGLDVEEDLEDAGVDPGARVVGPDLLSSELSFEADDARAHVLGSERARGQRRSLADADALEVGFVDLGSEANVLEVGDGERDRGRHVRHQGSRLDEAAEHRPRARRAELGLGKADLRLFEIGARGGDGGLGLATLLGAGGLAASGRACAPARTSKPSFFGRTRSSRTTSAPSSRASASAPSAAVVTS
jgi:hypothetical protein